MTSFSMNEMIAEVKREIAMRKNVYPKRVANQKMRQSEADYQIGALTAVLHKLMSINGNGAPS